MLRNMASETVTGSLAIHAQENCALLYYNLCSYASYLVHILSYKYSYTSYYLLIFCVFINDDTLHHCIFVLRA